MRLFLVAILVILTVCNSNGQEANQNKLHLGIFGFSSSVISSRISEEIPLAVNTWLSVDIWNSDIPITNRIALCTSFKIYKRKLNYKSRAYLVGFTSGYKSGYRNTTISGLMSVGLSLKLRQFERSCFLVKPIVGYTRNLYYIPNGIYNSGGVPDFTGVMGNTDRFRYRYSYRYKMPEFSPVFRLEVNQRFYTQNFTHGFVGWFMLLPPTKFKVSAESLSKHSGIEYISKEHMQPITYVIGIGYQFGKQY